MAKPEWGAKHVCQSCGARFYDMRKEPAVCPSCKTVQDTKSKVASRKGRPEPEPKPVKERRRPTPVPETAETPADEFAGDEIEEKDDVAIEDAADLGEDDDIPEVIEKPGEEER
ncbi:MAG: TIGR02300 family protein [Alphaproteobacteria bacterium]|nr:TIGR02300 family protein [Alphaproteobacteria bacterium]